MRVSSFTYSIHKQFQGSSGNYQRKMMPVIVCIGLAGLHFWPSGAVVYPSRDTATFLDHDIDFVRARKIFRKHQGTLRLIASLKPPAYGEWSAWDIYVRAGYILITAIQGQALTVLSGGPGSTDKCSCIAVARRVRRSVAGPFIKTVGRQEARRLFGITLSVREKLQPDSFVGISYRNIVLKVWWRCVCF
jgi:hypothetical protein